MTVFGNFAYFRTAGILEWILSIVGVFYIWAFVGFFEYVLKDYIPRFLLSSPALRSNTKAERSMNVAPY